MAGTSSEADVAVAQPVSAPLSRAAIFLVVTMNPGADEPPPYARSAPTSAASFGRSSFAISKPGFPA